MTDYNEEQSNELEALESIYPGELTVIATEPFHSFTLPIKAEFEELDMHESVSCDLQFTYTATYPDEPPLIEIADSENLEECHLNQLKNVMHEEAADTVGMVMVFTLMSAAQDKLCDIVEQIVKDRQAEKERQEEEREEAERKKFEGTCVSIETFLAWKTKFDAEIMELKRRRGELDTKSNKLTGKELFMQDSTMDDSDVKFLEEDGDTVQVDESLFQDLDDLDLES